MLSRCISQNCSNDVLFIIVNLSHHARSYDKWIEKGGFSISRCSLVYSGKLGEGTSCLVIARSVTTRQSS